MNVINCLLTSTACFSAVQVQENVTDLPNHPKYKTIFPLSPMPKSVVVAVRDIPRNTNQILNL